MNSDKIKSAEKMINASVILRLFVVSIYALLLAYLFSKDAWLLLHSDGVKLLLPVIIGFLIDMIFTLLWKASAVLNIFHLGCYILFGGAFYIMYFSLAFENLLTATVLNITKVLTFDWLLDHIVFFWGIGLIPFFMYGIGRGKLKKAKIKQSTGDENEHI